MPKAGGAPTFLDLARQIDPDVRGEVFFNDDRFLNFGKLSTESNQEFGRIGFDTSGTPIFKIEVTRDGTGTFRDMSFSTGGFERIRVLSTGGLIVGATASPNGQTTALEVSGTKGVGTFGYATDQLTTHDDKDKVTGSGGALNFTGFVDAGVNVRTLGKIEAQTVAAANNADMVFFQHRAGALVQGGRFLADGLFIVGTNTIRTVTGSIAEFRNDRNSETAIRVINQTSNTAATSILEVAQDVNTAIRGQLISFSSSFTTSGQDIAGEVQLKAFNFIGGLTGVAIRAVAAVPIRFITTDVERARFLSTGQWLVGAATQAGTEMARIRHSTTGFGLLVDGGGATGTNIGIRVSHDSGGVLDLLAINAPSNAVSVTQTTGTGGMTVGTVSASALNLLATNVIRVIITVNGFTIQNAGDTNSSPLVINKIARNGVVEINNLSTSPTLTQAGLKIRMNSPASVGLLLTADRAGFGVGREAGAAHVFQDIGTVGLIIGTTTAGPLKIKTNQIQRAIVDSDGNWIFNQGVQTSGSPTFLDFVSAAHTTLAAGVEAITANLNFSATTQFATGAIATQRTMFVQGQTLAFVGASVVTTATTLEVGSPVAGANATITNNFAARFIGNVEITGKLTVGGAIDPISVTLSGGGTAHFQQWGNGTTAAVSAAGTGRLIYNDTTKVFQFSADGAAFAVLGGGPGSDTTAFHNGGDSFAGLATIGTNDANALAFETNNVERWRISASAFTITGQSTSGLIVGGNTTTSTLNLRSSATGTGGNINLLGFKLCVISQTAQTSGSGARIIQTIGGAHTNLTASAELTDLDFGMARNVQFATGAMANLRAARFTPPTYAFVAASTITLAATVAITGAIVAGTNASITTSNGLLIQSNAVGAGVTTAYGLFANAPTGATTNRAIGFNGNMVMDGDHDFTPTTTNQGELGTDALKWKRIRATDIVADDIHLKGRGQDYTIFESKDGLRLRNNKTRKTYRMLMEEVEV